MPKRTSKTPGRSRDANQIAAGIVAKLAGDEPPATKGPQKNPAAVALGRLGGLKGGKARAEKLSVARRKAIARTAATARWAKHSESP